MKQIGYRLTDPRDPVVLDALTRTCPDCNQAPDEWCIGIAENSRTCGRRRTRLHFARCKFNPPSDLGVNVKAGVR